MRSGLRGLIELLLRNPVPGKEFFEPGLRRLRDPAENIGEPGLRVDTRALRSGVGQAGRHRARATGPYVRLRRSKLSKQPYLIPSNARSSTHLPTPHDGWGRGLIG